jgi:hypothetical protein
MFSFTMHFLEKLSFATRGYLVRVEKGMLLTGCVVEV